MQLSPISIGFVLAIIVIIVGALMALGVVPVSPLIVGISLILLGLARLT